MSNALRESAHWAIAAGLLVIGVVGVAYQDFAMQWQPVPAWVPMRKMLAVLVGAITALLGLGLLVPSWRRSAATGLLVLMWLWAIVLHVPLVVTHVTQVTAWLGLAEITAVAAAATLIWLGTRSKPSSVELEIAARRIFGACALVFGLSHFVYADFTAAMVPKWMPAPYFWAIATGCAHVAAGVSLLTGVYVRHATFLFALMLLSFVVLLHVPRTFADPTSHVEWLMLGISLSLMGASWVVRESVVSSASACRLRTSSAPTAA